MHEGQILGKRTVEQDVERRDNPGVLLQKMLPVLLPRSTISRTSHRSTSRRPWYRSSGVQEAAGHGHRHPVRHDGPCGCGFVAVLFIKHWQDRRQSGPRPLPDRAMPGHGRCRRPCGAVPRVSSTVRGAISQRMTRNADEGWNPRSDRPHEPGSAWSVRGSWPPRLRTARWSRPITQTTPREPCRDGVPEGRTGLRRDACRRPGRSASAHPSAPRATIAWSIAVRRPR